MRKLLTLLAAGVLVLTACEKKTADPYEKPTVKIGISLPLTGNLAYAGQGMKASLQVFQENLSSNLKNNYKFIFEDNAWDTKRAASITNKFISLDKVDAIVDFGSTIGLVSSPLAERHEVLHFNACASDVSIAKGGHNFLITTLPQDEAVELANKIKQKYKRVAVLGQNDVSSTVTTEAVAKRLAEKGIAYQTFWVNPGVKDMRLLIEKMKRQNPDLYVVILYSPTLEVFVRQLKEAGINTPMVSVHFFANISDYRLIEGAEFVDYAVMDKELKQRVLNKTPGSNYEMCIGYIYDAAGILVEAFEAQGEEGAVAYIRNLKEKNGVVGKVLQSKDGVFSASPSFKRIENGKPFLVEE